MIGVIFPFVLRSKKGNQWRINYTGRNEILRTKWIMPYSLARWNQDNTKYIVSFLTFLFVWWTLGHPKACSKCSSVPNHTPLSLTMIRMVGTDTYPGHRVGSVFWVTLSLLLIAKEKSCITVCVAFSPSAMLSRTFFKHATWLLSSGERSFI